MSQPRTPREDDKLERTRYFPEQILSPADFARDREYLLHRQRRHNRMLHGWGIKLGLTVENVPVKGADDTDERKAYDAFEKQNGRIPEDVRTADGPVLFVKAGYAITPLGDEVYLPDSVYLNTSEELEGALVIIPAPCLSHLSPQKVDRRGKTYYLIVEAYESETHPVRAANTRCGDHPDHFEFSRIRDTLRFRLVQELPTPYENDDDERRRLIGKPERDSVCLGRITFSDTSVPTFSEEPRELLAAPTALPIPAQRHQPVDALEQLLNDDPSLDHLQDAFDSIEQEKKQLVDGLRLCLRPSGLEQLFCGHPANIALKKVSASHLFYGEPNEQLDRFFHRLAMTVSGLVDNDRIPGYIDSKKSSEDVKDKQIGERLQKALRTAVVTCWLARQWPESDLPAKV